MKKCILTTLELADFKAQNRIVNFFEKTRITGRNASGKTTVVSAINWLFTGTCDANSVKNADLYDNRFELTPQTPVAKVRATFLIDGVKTVLERTAKAQFNKEHGTGEYRKAASDKYTFSIDDIEVQAKRFDEWIESNIAPIDAIKYCLSGEFFTNLVVDDWQKARKILLLIAGEIKPTDYKGDYSIIAKYMDTLSIDEIKDRASKRIKEYEATMERDDNSIKANQDKIKEYKEIDFSADEKRIEECEDEIKNIDAVILGNSESLQPYIKKRDDAMERKRQIKQKAADRRLAYNNEQSEKESKANLVLRNIDNENSAIKKANEQQKKDYDDAVNKRHSLDDKKMALEKENDELHTKLKEVKERVFVAEKCAYCGQELPEDMIEQKRQQFNDTKNAEKDKIVARGKANRAEIERISNEITELDKFIEEQATKKPQEYKSKAEAERELNNIKQSFVAFEATEEYAKLKQEYDAIVIPSVPSIDNSENQRKKDELMDEIKKLSSNLGLKKEITRLEDKNKELEANIKKNGDEAAEHKAMLDKCKEYQKETADIISSRINGRMKNTLIVMEKVQKDGQRIPCCDVTQLDGVRYSTSNGAARIMMKVDIQRLFCEHFDIAMPVFIDECSILDDENKPSIDGFQMIYIYNAPNEFEVSEELC